MCSHLFGGTGPLGLGHGGWVHAAEDLAGIAAVGFGGPLLGAALGVGDIAGAGLVGAGVGALKGAVQGGNPLVGALEGGALSAAGAGLADAAGFGSAGTASGSPATGGAGISAAGAAAPTDLGADLPLGVNPDTGAPVFSPANAAAATTGPGFGAAPDTGAPVFAPTENAAGATVGTAPITPVTSTDLTAPTATPFVGLQDTTSGASTGPVAGANPDTGAPIYAPSGPSSLTQDIYSGYSNVTGALSGTSNATPGVQTGTLTPTTDTTGVTAGSSPGGTLTNAYGAVGTAPAQSNVFTNQVLGGNAPATGGGGVTIGDTSGGGIGGALGSVGKAITGNPALALGGALLGYDVLKGNQVPKGYNAINATATQLGTQATQLEGYLTSGTLPPGVATALSQAGNSAKAAIRSQYASMGESGSSAEQAALANVDNTIVSQGVTIATNLLNQGVNEAGLASQLYGQIMNYSLQSDAQLTQALGVLASASARPTTVTLAGTSS